MNDFDKWAEGWNDGMLNDPDNSVRVARAAAHAAWLEGRDAARDDLIQCLLATRGQSEGTTADAILTMFTAAPAVQWEPVGWQFWLDGTWWDGGNLTKQQRKNMEEAGVRVRDTYAAPQPAEQQPALAKYQPCGCVICTCEHETQCQGCGAKHCGTHPVGQLPAPAYIQPAEQQPDPFRGDNAALIRSAQSLLRLDDKGAFGPNGIGGHARNIITAFIARISADQQPAPDVTVLVEALELAIEYWRDRQQRYKNRRPKWVIAAESALAAYRKQGGDA